MVSKVAIFTGTRAEYGLLYWLIRDIKDNPALDLRLIVSGMHLSPEFGETWKQIVLDGFEIDAKVEMLLSSDTAVGVVKSMGLGLLGFAEALERIAPDVLVVLGDRFEALAVVQAALIMKIPVAHIHGGEITEGAYDDAIRHAISKMSILHFVAAEPYRQRVIQMGEDPVRVFNVGAIGLDHVKRGEFLSLEALSQSLYFKIVSPFMLVTYHPVTLAEEDPEQSFCALLDALDSFPDRQVIITYPNADNGGRRIISLIEKYAAANVGRVLAIPSLGFKRYLSTLRYASVVVGNSSSGIIEVPSFGLPTVNIGSRQRGRLAAETVIHCDPVTDAIRQAITLALSEEFSGKCKHAENPYGQGEASQKIVQQLIKFDGSTSKKFYDLDLL